MPYTARHELYNKLFESTELSDEAIAGISGHRSAAALWHYKHLRDEHQRPVTTALKSLITDAINRELSPSAPFERLQTRELSLDREAKNRKRLTPARGRASRDLGQPLDQTKIGLASRSGRWAGPC